MVRRCCSYSPPSSDFWKVLPFPCSELAWVFVRCPLLPVLPPPTCSQGLISRTFFYLSGYTLFWASVFPSVKWGDALTPSAEPARDIWLLLRVGAGSFFSGSLKSGAPPDTSPPPVPPPFPLLSKCLIDNKITVTAISIPRPQPSPVLSTLHLFLY